VRGGAGRRPLPRTQPSWVPCGGLGTAAPPLAPKPPAFRHTLPPPATARILAGRRGGRPDA